MWRHHYTDKASLLWMNLSSQPVCICGTIPYFEILASKPPSKWPVTPACSTERWTCYQVPAGCLTLGLEPWGGWKERWCLPGREPGRPPVITWRKEEIGQRGGESLAGRRNSQKINELNTVRKPAALEPCLGGSRDSASSSGEETPAGALRAWGAAWPAP